ncbi:hypothetical protein KFE25_005332 [Diacronema lutheri]|uniref:Uncharacterized protein n=1 Tax=Diacronema lutheri TaxID=2081491 RepID=A0A8J5XJY6_DIALT|nr:hypothetical protein KFE25_005332 [Diacronema lutheri]
MAVLASPAELQLKTAEARLHELRMLSGERNEYVGGYGGGHLHTSSHAETLELEKERRDIAAEVKRLKDVVADERKALKKTAKAASDVANWTARLLDGDAHFASGVDALDSALVARTRGLVSRDDWARERDKLESELAAEATATAAKAKQAEDEALAAKARRKRKRERAEQSRLSFAADGEGDAASGAE